MSELSVVYAPAGPDEQGLLFPHGGSDQSLLRASGGNTHQFCDITNNLDVGLVILDAQSHVLSANRIALGMLNAGDGLRFDDGRFSARSVSAALALAAALQLVMAMPGTAVDGAGAPRVLMVPRAGKAALTLGIFPGPAATDAPVKGTCPAAVILVSDPDQKFSESIKLSCELYGLTPTETRLAGYLIDGLTLSEAASEMKLSPATVRSYLKQVFAKTGVHRQASLIRLLIGSRLPIIAPLVQRIARPVR